MQENELAKEIKIANLKMEFEKTTENRKKYNELNDEEKRFFQWYFKNITGFDFVQDENTPYGRADEYNQDFWIKVWDKEIEKKDGKWIKIEKKETDAGVCVEKEEIAPPSFVPVVTAPLKAFHMQSSHRSVGKKGKDGDKAPQPQNHVDMDQQIIVLNDPETGKGGSVYEEESGRPNGGNKGKKSKGRETKGGRNGKEPKKPKNGVK